MPLRRWSVDYRQQLSWLFLDDEEKIIIVPDTKRKITVHDTKTKITVARGVHDEINSEGSLILRGD